MKPTTIYQNLFWNEWKLKPFSNVYNLTLAFKLEGHLDEQKLLDVLEQLIQSSDVFFTTFTEIDGQLYSTTHEKHAPDIKIENLSTQNNQPGDKINGFIDSIKNHQFDLTQYPLYKIGLAKVKTNDYVLVLNVHHILIDSLSEQKIIKYIIDSYKNGSKGENITHQSSLLSQNTPVTTLKNENKKYWLSQIKRISYQNPQFSFEKNKKITGQYQYFNLQKHDFNALIEQAKQHETNLFCLINSIYSICIYQTFGKKQCVLCYPANTRAKQASNEIGCFVNVLPLIVNLNSHMRYSEVIKQTTKEHDLAKTHKEYPFTDIALMAHEQLGIDSKLIFNIGIASTCINKANKNLGDIRIRSIPEKSSDTIYAINLEYEVIDDALEMRLQYRTDLFDKDFANAFIGRLLKITKAVLANPEKNIDTFSALNKEDQKKIIVNWNQTTTIFKHEYPVYDLFTKQVIKHQNKNAIIFNDEKISYLSLNNRIDKLAGHIVHLSTSQSGYIPVVIDRSINMIVSLFAVLKAGFAYTPIDPNFPDQRIKFILNECKAKILLTEEKYHHRLSQLWDKRENIQLVSLDSFWKQTSNDKKTHFREIKLTDIAYLLYTSGSTGTPKGVRVTHKSLTNLLLSLKKRLNFSCKDIALSATPYTFDISGVEIYSPLITGGTCLLAGGSVAKNPKLLSSLIEKERPTFIQMTPAKWQLLLNEKWTCKRNITLLSCGEEMSKDLAKALLKKSNFVWNAYGPTETTIYSTLYKLSNTTIEHREKIPIGRPLDNTSVYVLDEGLAPTPIGSAGELYIGGKGLAQGYLKRPDINAQVFIENPNLSNFIKTDRLYKTGDRVKWLPDGNLEYIGRKDNQVKYHGFRIELGEIELSMQKHPDIEQCTVIVKNEQLVAYYISKKTNNLSEEDIKNFIILELPDHMVPQIIKKIDSFPLTMSGKINRKKLLTLNILSQAEFIPPNSEFEKITADIWHRHLNENKIGLLDNFFMLGGHSLTAIKIASDINKKTGIDCLPGTIFEHPILKEFSSWLENQHHSKHKQKKSILSHAKRHAMIPLSCSQERFLLLNKIPASSSAYNIVYAWKLHGKINDNLLEKSISYILDRHEILRTIYVENNTSDFYQKILPSTFFSLKREEIAPNNIDQYLKKEISRTFNLTNEPPFYFSLLKAGKENLIFILNFHHISADQQTIRFFIQEISTYYQKQIKGDRCSLNKPLYQYADFACWQREHLKKDLLDESLQFWKKYLYKYKELELPKDFSLGHDSRDATASYDFNVDPQIVDNLSSILKAEQTTLYTILLSVLYVLLNRYTHQDDILIGTPITERMDQDMQNIMGCFANTTVIRAKIDNSLSFSSHLSAVKNTMKQILSQEQIPFHHLIDGLKINRVSGRAPLIQVFFSIEYLSEYIHFKLPDLEITPVPVPTLQSKFDLHFSFQETPKGLMGRIEYNTDLYRQSTIAQMADHFSQLIKCFSKKPALPINKPCLLTDNEKSQLIIDWNKTDSPPVTEKEIHHIIMAQIKRAPDALAVIDEDGDSLSYQELAELSQIISEKINRCTDEKQVVALLMHRHKYAIAAILGILRSDRVYVPIVPTSPKQLIDNILTETQCHIVVTDDMFLKKQRGLLGNRIANIDNLVNTEISLVKLTEMPAQKTNLFIDEETAYIIYTSGSTGKPKGTMVSHESAINCAYSVINHINVTKKDTFLSVTSFSFDVFVLDFLLPLFTGASVVLVNENSRLDSQKIKKLIDIHNVSIMQATPTLWEILIARGWTRKERFRILSAGEKLSLDLGCKLNQYGDVYNFYGPTEATIYATYTKVENPKTSHIGKPLDNVKCYILDKQLNPVPTGILGELYIGGKGVAQGYINNKELTTKKFIENPFSKKGEKMYATGDLASWLPDGNINYQGRKDNQIKLRGYRIELSGIEGVIKTYPGINEAVVVLKNDKHRGDHLVAFLTLEKQSKEISRQKLVKHSQDRMQSYMVPSIFIHLNAMPITANGKIDRAALKKQDILQASTLLDKGTYAKQTTPTSASAIIESVFKHLLNVDNINHHHNLFDIGVNSLLLVKAANVLQEKHNVTIEIADFFKHPTVSDLSHAINYKNPHQDNTDHGLTPRHTQNSNSPDSSIAIIACSGAFPGSESLDDFWNNVSHGKETITQFSQDELSKSGVDENTLKNSNYVKARGILKNVDLFDANFFNMTPKEAMTIDPQQRLFLEKSWEALEISGYSPTKYHGRIAVVAGADDSNYNTEENTTFNIQSLIANETKSFLSTKTSYHLDLKGPSINVNTACSTSLTAISTACQLLVSGQSDIALAGAVSIKLPQQQGYMYQPDSILSPDGHCRAFDKSAQGTVPSAGVGVVVLKRLKEALDDNDHILAVIKGVGMNNDGHNKVGYAAPSPEGQTSCIKQALHNAKLNPSDIQYIETHGTGTLLGDPIEIKALSSVFDDNISHKKHCALGSVKTNMGHADAASGMAGFIKTVYSLYNKKMPPSIHFKEQNPHIHFEDSPFYVNTKLKAWEKKNDSPRRAGVSSFGIGGTNAHIVLEETPNQSSHKLTAKKPFYILTFSAKTPSALKKTLENMIQHLNAIDKHDSSTKHLLADMAYTLQIGRTEFPYRYAIASDSISSTLDQLGDKVNNISLEKKTNDNLRKQVVLMFPGQGSQYEGMGSFLYKTEKIFQSSINACCKLLNPHLDINLRDIMFSSSAHPQNKEYNLNNTEYTQPALFCIEYALAKQLESWGIKPDYLIGHSLGEYVAAHLAGVFTLEDVLKIIAFRAKLMGKLQAGSMLAVKSSLSSIKPLIPDHCEIAALNSPSDLVISGPSDKIRNLKNKLKDLNIPSKQVNTSSAFHSFMVDDIVHTLVSEISSYQLSKPSMPIISNLTGEEIDPKLISTPAYWGKQLRQTVKFSQSVLTLFDKTDAHFFIECGPGHTLSYFVKQHLHENNKSAALITPLPKARSTETAHHKNEKTIYESLANYWKQGGSVNWSNLYVDEPRNRTPLPTYPFERKRYWINKTKDSYDKKLNDINHFLYHTSWQQSEALTAINIPTSKLNKKMTWVLFVDNTGITNALISLLKKQGQTVITVSIGTCFKETSHQCFEINPRLIDDYQMLLNKTKNQHDSETNIVHFWPNSLTNESCISDTSLESTHYRGLMSLVFIAQSISFISPKSQFRILTVSRQLHHVVLNDVLSPEKTALLGACHVIPLEYRNITIGNVDLPLKEAIGISLETLASCLLHETSILNKQTFEPIAYRFGYRWRRVHSTLDTSKNHQDISVRKKGTYLIIGGTGGIGLTLATHLIEEHEATVVLTTRKTLPPESEWDSWIQNTDKTNSLYPIITSLNQWKLNKVNFLVLSADITNMSDMKKIFSDTDKKFGKIDGIIHAAGVPSSGLIARKTLNDIDKVLQSKLQGVYILSELCKEKPIDFILFCSSITAFVGGIGQLDYCAANNILNAFAHSNKFHKQTKIKSLCWNAWTSVGMKDKYLKKNHKLGLSHTPTPEDNDITPSQGKQLFSTALTLPHSQIVVSNTPPNNYYNHIVKLSNEFYSNNKRTPKIQTSSIIDNMSDSEKIISLFKKCLGIETINLDDNFFDLGGTSLSALELIEMLNHSFSSNMRLQDIYIAKTVSELLTLIKKPEYTFKTDSPIVILRKATGKKPLFLIHPVGGAVFCFFNLIPELPETLPVYAIQDLGIFSEKYPFKCLEDMASFYLSEIKKIQPSGPYNIAGYSMGGTLAFEIARQLKGSYQEDIDFLGLIDSWAIFSNISKDKKHFKKAMLRQYESLIKNQYPAHFNNLNSWLDRQWDRMQLLCTYKPKKIDTDIVLFKATDLLPEYTTIEDPCNGWQKLTTQTVHLYELPANHETILSDFFIKQMGIYFRESLLSYNSLIKKEVAHVS